MIFAFLSLPEVLGVDETGVGSLEGAFAGDSAGGFEGGSEGRFGGFEGGFEDMMFCQ